MRRRTDYRTFDLTFPCPECGYKMRAFEIIHTDGEHVRCVNCKKDVPYGVRKAPLTAVPERIPTDGKEKHRS